MLKNLFIITLIFVDNMYSSGSYQYPTNIQLRIMKRFHSLPIIRTKSIYKIHNDTYDEYVYKNRINNTYIHTQN